MSIFNIRPTDLIVGTRIRIDWHYYRGEGVIVEAFNGEISVRVDNPKACTSGWTGNKVPFKEHEGFCLGYLVTKNGKVDCPSVSILEIISGAPPKAVATEKTVNELEDKFYRDLEDEL